MKKRYEIKNLHCPDCAAKIENALKNSEGVKKATLNFSLGTLDIECEEFVDVKKIIKSVEENVEISDEKNHNKHKQLTFIILSSASLVLSLITGIWYFAIVSYLISGADVIKKSILNMRKKSFLDENFLMSVATIGAILLKEFPEAAAVMVFYKTGEYFQDLAVDKSRKSIKSLIESTPKHAWLVSGSQLLETDPQKLEPGQIVLVKPGEKVPADGIVVEGDAYIDSSPITGEFIPRHVAASDSVLAGTIVRESSLKIKVTKKYSDSSMANILKLVESASERKAKTEKFITTFARYYTPAVVITATLVSFLIPVILNESFNQWIYRGLILLVISCPCALVLAIPLTYFAGIGKSSKRGILIKGASYLDTLANVKNIVFDKTGTLTHGSFEITNINSVNGFSKDDLLMYSAHAEANSNHPIARSILKHFKKIDHSLVKNFHELNGFGVICSINGKLVHVGNDKLLHRENIPHPETVCKLDEKSTVHVSVNRLYAGNILLADKLKESSRKTVDLLKSKGLSVYMLTGDNESAAREIAEKLSNIDYYSELLPENKIDILEKKILKSGKTAFVGDGINDTPALARADVGIAMNGFGNDAVVEIADVVIMGAEPIKIVESINIARMTKKIVLENIFFAITIKLLFMFFAITGKATMWQGVFADTGVALLCVLNSLRVLFSRKTEI